MNKIKTVKIRNEDGSVSEESYSISVDARNVDMDNGKDLQYTVGEIDVDNDGNIAEQLKKTIYKSDIIDNLTTADAEKVLSANQGKVLNEAVTALDLNVKNKIFYFDTVADMKNAKLNIKDMAVTLGYYRVNDGGGACYIIEEEMEKDFFDIALANSLNAVFLNKKEFNILQVGAKKDDDTFDNNFILSTIFNDSYFNDATVYISTGTYYTTALQTPHGARENTTKNLTIIGLGNPIIKLLKPKSVKTIMGTYTGNYTVSRGIATLDLGENCTVATMQLADNKEFYYFKINDKNLVPDELKEGLVLEGTLSYTKAIIAGIDKNDPDGEGTARIYIYETYNDYTRFLNYKTANSILQEPLLVRPNLREDTLYIHFEDNIIPEYAIVGRQLEQIETGKKGRINSVTISFGDNNFIGINCLNYNRNIFITPNIYLDSNVTFNINEWKVSSYTMFSINKFINFTMRGITWDGDNLKESYYNNIYNNYNVCITGGCKNVLIENCTFQNAVMAGFQIGGTGGSMYKIAAHDFPEDVTIRKCQFYNNGRNDLEIIYGYNINIEDCHFDRRVDFEANGTEPFCNISVNNCSFYELVVYNPGGTSATHNVNVSNSRIIRLANADASVLNLNNCTIHSFTPQISTTKAVNCYFNLLEGVIGNEFLNFVNTSLYSFYQNKPGGQAGKAKLYFNNCIVDLSLATATQYIQSIGEFKIDNSIIVSSTTRKTLNDYRTIYKCHNSTFKNIEFEGGAGNLGSVTTGTEFEGCNFLAKDNTILTSNVCLRNAIVGGIFKNCYFEESVKCYLAHHSFINCILNATTKPILISRQGIYCSGIKTHDGTGINWNWIGTPIGGWKVQFNDIEFSPEINNKLGIKNEYTTVSTSSVDDSCRGYYVGNTDLIACRLYYENDTLNKKDISF